MRTCGTISAYNNGCRCTECRQVAARRRRDYRARHRAHEQICPWCSEWFVLAGNHERYCESRRAVA